MKWVIDLVLLVIFLCFFFFLVGSFRYFSVVFLGLGRIFLGSFKYFPRVLRGFSLYSRCFYTLLDTSRFEVIRSEM